MKLKNLLAIQSALMFTHVASQTCSHRPVGNNYKGRLKGTNTVKRYCPKSNSWIHLMSERLFRRMYRMKKKSFFDLLKTIKPHLQSRGGKRKRGKDPNGPITAAYRLSMSLRYFAGGNPLDISSNHQVGENEVLRSVWFVIDAIHAAPELKISFPVSHEKQSSIARGFQEKSSINIPNCVGAIDGILIWTHKPNINHMKEEECFNEKKMFCGRKKFGFNMQATCDSRGRFLDIEIRFPGSTLDYYAFSRSNLKEKVGKAGFLAPGLALFGDNAYVNTPYMVVPFRNPGSDLQKDAFNFYQSQIQISIECAFGMLVHRWGILRKPIPMNISIPKTTSLTLALCKLHNYCIDRENTEELYAPVENDVCFIVQEGGLFLPRMDRNSNSWSYQTGVDRLTGLLDGGDHSDDYDSQNDTVRRPFRCANQLPNQVILDYVKENNLRRPKFNIRRNQGR